MSERDMGPFAGMDKALERAITGYGTPPFREIVRVSVRSVGNYDFDSLPTTLGEWHAWLETAKSATPAEYREHLNCVLSWESGYYDSGDNASLDIWYARPETDEEMTARVNRGIAYVRAKEAGERATYEALKRKFSANVNTP